MQGRKKADILQTVLPRLPLSDASSPNMELSRIYWSNNITWTLLEHLPSKCLDKGLAQIEDSGIDILRHTHSKKTCGLSKTGHETPSEVST